MSHPIIYLDHAAATPLDAKVLEAMLPFFETNFYNPSANYSAANKIKEAIDRARSQVAYWLGAKSSEIIFTAGGTEANNLAIHGIMRRFGSECNIVVSKIEHESVLEPARKYECREVAVLADGRIDLKDLASKIDKNTRLVSIMLANNEIGTIMPLREVSQIIRDKRKLNPSLPLYFHSDAAQAGNYLDLHTSRLDVDLMTINGGKIYGPKQSGALFVKAGTILEPLISGGGQERGLRSGTENVAACVGLAAALHSVQTKRNQEVARLKNLQSRFIEMLEKEIPSVKINGSLHYRLPNNVHITIPGQDNERLIFKLDALGIMVAAGSACSASDEEASHVLKAIGLSENDAQSSLRMTMGRNTDLEMLEVCMQKLKKLV